MQPVNKAGERAGADSRRGEVRVVDLSRTPSHRAELGPVHREVLQALARVATGIASRDEILRAVRDRSVAEVEIALRDLSLLGLARVVWRSAFRFVAFLTRDGESLVNAGEPFRLQTRRRAAIA